MSLRRVLVSSPAYIVSHYLSFQSSHTVVLASNAHLRIASITLEDEIVESPIAGLASSGTVDSCPPFLVITFVVYSQPLHSSANLREGESWGCRSTTFISLDHSVFTCQESSLIPLRGSHMSSIALPTHRRTRPCSDSCSRISMSSSTSALWYSRDMMTTMDQLDHPSATWATLPSFFSSQL